MRGSVIDHLDGADHRVFTNRVVANLSNLLVILVNEYLLVSFREHRIDMTLELEKFNCNTWGRRVELNIVNDVTCRVYKKSSLIRVGKKVSREISQLVFLVLIEFFLPLNLKFLCVKQRKNIRG